MHKQLTNRVMNLLLAGDHYVLTVLRNQFHSASISSVEDTSVGMFVDFSVSEPERLEEQKGVKRDFEVGDVHGIAGRSGVGFILFVRDGCISMLEGYSYEDADWEKVTDDIELTYGDHGRDFKTLSSSWQI